MASSWVTSSPTLSSRPWSSVRSSPFTDNSMARATDSSMRAFSRRKRSCVSRMISSIRAAVSSCASSDLMVSWFASRPSRGMFASSDCTTCSSMRRRALLSAAPRNAMVWQTSTPWCRLAPISVKRSRRGPSVPGHASPKLELALRRPRRTRATVRADLRGDRGSSTAGAARARPAAPSRRAEQHRTERAAADEDAERGAGAGRDDRGWRHHGLAPCVS